MPQLGETTNKILISKTGRRKRRYFIWVKCPECNKEHWADYYHIKNGKPKRPGLCFPCSSYCQQGAKSYRWKGGRQKTSQGYIKVRIARNDFFYPMVGRKGYVLEHRLIVAKALKRCLLPWETVHHKEGYAKDDNRYPETLELLPNRHKHDALTKMSNYIKELEAEIKKLKKENFVRPD